MQCPNLGKCGLPFAEGLENCLLELQGQSKGDELVREMKAVSLLGFLSPPSNRGSGSHFIMDTLPWCHVTRHTRH